MLPAYFVGTEVEARGLRWEIVDVRAMGDQTMLRLRGLDSIFTRTEVDLLVPFEEVRPIAQDFTYTRRPNSPTGAPTSRLFCCSSHLAHMPLHSCNPDGFA